MANRRLPVAIELGPMPCKAVNATIDLELDDGIVVMSGRAQIHASRKRPADYSKCLPHIAAIVCNPLYIGDDIKNRDKIEFIGRIRSIDEVILVAVSVLRDGAGKYHVATFYPISEAKVTSRLGKGFLKIARLKK